MATSQHFKLSEIRANNPINSQIRSTIETAFYGNNVERITTVKEAYKLAANSPGTIVTDIPVYKPEAMGLDPDTKVLLFNDGAVKGRAAAARRVLGEPGIDVEEYGSIIREAIYDTRFRKLYHANAYIGLDKDLW